MIAILKDKKNIKKSKVYTYEEYLRREEKSIEKHEFYNGKIIKRQTVYISQSEIAVNIISAIKQALKTFPNTFRVFDSSLKTHINALNISVYPTISIAKDKLEYWQNNQKVITNPITIIEVLPYGLNAFDIARRFEFYKELPSFQEYVLVSTDTFSVETRFREEPDLWRIKTETNIENTVNLRSLGVSISMVDIYENIVFPLKK
jgi:Uma2 family endonuclease